MTAAMLERPMTVVRTDEVLSHFNCPACQGWWTVGDFDRVHRLSLDRVI